MTGARFREPNIADLSWQEQAACKGKPSDLFFPTRGDPYHAREPKAICAVCPSQKPCLAYALSIVELTGIWGGTSERERRRIRQQRKRRKRVA